MKKNKAAQQLGRRGGIARAKVLSKKRRSEIARMAVQARIQQKKQRDLEDLFYSSTKDTKDDFSI